MSDSTTHRFTTADLRAYTNESRAASLLGAFAGLWVVVAILGLVGVSGPITTLQELLTVLAVYAGLAYAVGGLWRYSRNDAVVILGVMVALYVVFGLASYVFLDMGLNGLANTMVRLTFLAAVYAMLVLALNLHWGYTGLFNIGVAGFMAVGVYSMAIISSQELGLGLPLPVGIVGGVIAAALVGLVAALPALRLEADYLAIVTVAFAEIIRLLFNSQAFSEVTVFGATIGTGGGQGISMPSNPIRALFYTDPSNPGAGLTAIGQATIGTLDSLQVAFVSGVGIQSSVVISGAYVLVLAVFVAGIYWLLKRIGNSPFGRVLKAIREDEMVANSLGKNTQLFKIKTFMVGCALMGLAGILWRGSTGYTVPSDYMPIQTFYVFLALIIGGAGSNTGSVIGGIVFGTLLFEGPTMVARVLPEIFAGLFGTDLTNAPSNFVGAVAPLASLDIAPFVAYALRNISTLRFIFLGVLIIYLMQNRPEGLLGHRKEAAAAVDIGAPTDGGDQE